jgi:hypothetical protein
MKFNIWDLTLYEQAAVQMCQRLQEDPYATTMDENGQHHPRWVSYAERMKEHALMLKCMRDYGPHGEPL